jgi:hypothetical protein
MAKLFVSQLLALLALGIFFGVTLPALPAQRAAARVEGSARNQVAVSPKSNKL